MESDSVLPQNHLKLTRLGATPAGTQSTGSGL